MDPDALLNENIDVIVAALLGKYMPNKIIVDWDGATRSSVMEVTTQVRDQFYGDKIHTVPASKIVVSFPISGTAEMLDYRASTFSMSGEYGKVAGGAVVVEVVDRTLTTAVIQEQIKQVRKNIDQRVDWANADLARFYATADQAIRSAHASRKQRVLNDRAVEESLGIPVRTSAAPRPPVTAHRKQVALQVRKEQSKFVPEPVLADAVYQDILEVVRSWANTLERSPRTAGKLDEEELRDLLLGTLNGYWKGAAGGELFNGDGKTDILIREGDRNAFIAECKIWRGPKGVAGALNQLLSYLVWRDSKAALVMFIKTADPAATIDKLHVAVQAHGSYVLTKDAANPGSRVDYIVAADDEGRCVSLAVLPVIIRAEES
ncbi:hypothetical protein [Parafrankia sp. FMc2]|uniref:hypothetical protein n=1 Tax=Parafrankia sp. FMc2 TaxID=3233196 RepID=UPI0034D6ACFE